jgi:hypothetical protein
MVMKNFCNFIKNLFSKKTTTTTTKKWTPSPLPTPPYLIYVSPHNVNGPEEDVSKICNSGVVTIYSDCEKLTMGCYVCADSNATDFETLAGKYFHDYSNDVVYYVQEVDGMIMNVGSCEL